jgi:hypothetical protein
MSVLTFAEDFTSQVTLDSSLTGTPDSGLYWNRGVHPVVTVDNLLSLLPSLTQSFTAYSDVATYQSFDVSRSKRDLVLSEGKVYQSIKADNVGNPLDDSDYWMETTVESLRVKSFVWSVQDNVKSALSLNRKLIESQYIYNITTAYNSGIPRNVVLSGNYSGWAFEPKGSDYVKIRINQIALQANTTDVVELYVINQGRLIDTLLLHPNNGALEFEQLGYTISGKGRFVFAFASQSVQSNSSYNDALKYDGFVCYPVTGIGESPAASRYSVGVTGNGLSFNVSAYLDSSVYLTNNELDFARFYQSQFEMDFIKLAMSNSNAESNREIHNLNSDRVMQLLATEGLDTEMNTVAKKYLAEKKMAEEAINRTFDKFLKVDNGFSVTRRTI